MPGCSTATLARLLAPPAEFSMTLMLQVAVCLHVPSLVKQPCWPLSNRATPAHSPQPTRPLPCSRPQIHGNLCMSAVVVTSTLDWKLHGFDLLSEHALPGDFALRATSWMVPAQYQAGEVARQEWDTIRQSPPWAVDAWGLGCMLQVEKGLDRGREERGRRQLQQLPC